MSHSINENINPEPKETKEELADQAENGELKKGYNEHNPAQEGGAFEPDSKDDNTSNEPPKAEDI